MTDIDCFNLLSSLEMNLYQPGIEDSFNNNELNQFKNYRSSYKNQVDKVRNHAASILLDKLQQNESSLKNGITNLESAIEHIEDKINFLSTLNNVVGLVATILKVVA